MTKEKKCQKNNCKGTPSGESKYCQKHECQKDGCLNQNGTTLWSTRTTDKKQPGEYCKTHGNGACIAIAYAKCTKAAPYNGEKLYDSPGDGRRSVCKEHKYGPCQGKNSDGSSCTNFADSAEGLCRNHKCKPCEGRRNDGTQCNNKQTLQIDEIWLCEGCRKGECAECKSTTPPFYVGLCRKCHLGKCAAPNCPSDAIFECKTNKFGCKHESDIYCESHCLNGPNHVKNNATYFYFFRIKEMAASGKTEIFQVFGITEAIHSRFSTYVGHLNKSTKAKPLGTFQYMKIPVGKPYELEYAFKDKYGLWPTSAPKVKTSASGIDGTKRESFLVDSNDKASKEALKDFKNLLDECEKYEETYADYEKKGRTFQKNEKI